MSERQKDFEGLTIERAEIVDLDGAQLELTFTDGSLVRLTGYTYGSGPLSIDWKE